MNPSDCSSFYNCAFAGSSILPSSCTPGLFWNDVAKVCDWVSVGCNAAPVQVTTTLSPPVITSLEPLTTLPFTTQPQTNPETEATQTNQDTAATQANPVATSSNLLN